MNDAAQKYLAGFLAARGANGNGVQAKPDRLPADRIVGAPEAPAAVRGLQTPSFQERIKRELHPLDALPRLLANAKANQPPGADDQFRFQWFGLFYQGPRQDAFLLRIRLPGGRLRAFQLAGLAAITQELGDGCVVCNAQGGLDVPGVSVRAAPEVMRRVEAIGLCTLLSGGDCVRSVRGGEHEGLAPSPGPPTIFPLVCELEQALRLDRRLADLPDHCEVVLRGVNDLPFPLAEDGHDPAEAIVFQALNVGSERVDLPAAGDPLFFTVALPGPGVLGVILTANQVVPACSELLRVWAGQGDRSDRQRASLTHFCATVGGEPLRERLAMAVGLARAAISETPTVHIETRTQPMDGMPVPAGRWLSEDLIRLAEAARENESGEIRLAAGRVYFPVAPADSVRLA